MQLWICTKSIILDTYASGQKHILRYRQKNDKDEIERVTDVYYESMKVLNLYFLFDIYA